jgi:hypothetical protein
VKRCHESNRVDRRRIMFIDGLRRCHPPCLPPGGTAAANGSGLAPALSRLRGTYAPTRSGGGTRFSRESAGGPANSLLALDSGRSGMRLKNKAGVYRSAWEFGVSQVFL